MNKNKREKNTVVATVELCRYMYPKSGHNDGDFGIASVYVNQMLQGAMKLNDQWKTAIIKGNMPRLKTGITYKLKAEEVYNEQFKSYQYDITYISMQQALETKKDRETFLKNILTEKQVKGLLENFENPLQIILEEDVEKLCTVKGIKNKTAQEIINKVVNNMDYSGALVELEKYDMTNAMIKKLVDRYGSPEVVVAKVKENPYMLANEIEGIGFSKADEIALIGGMKPDSMHRFESFIMHYLKEEAVGGRSYVPQRELMGAIMENLDTAFNTDKGMENLKKAIYSLNDREILWWNESKTCMALQKYKDIEYAIAKEIHRLKDSSYKFAYGKWEKEIDKIEEAQGWKYTQEQRVGVKTTLDNNVVAITGLAGTGKTTVTKAMTQILENYQISQCALSGRASQRISENTGMEAHTIHRLLGRALGGGFLHNENNKLDTEILIFDEASMPNIELVLALLKAIQTGSKLIIIGDFGQLSSIGAGNFFKDILESGVIPVVRLTEVHRQAQASAIISKSIDIRNQVQLFDCTFEGDMTLGELQDLDLCIRENRDVLPSLVLERFHKEYLEVGKDINKVQIIVPTRMRGELCCKSLNYKVQEKYNAHNPDEGIFIRGKYEYTLFNNDKVIVTKNNKKVYNTDGEQVEIFNGNLGTIVEIDVDKKSIVVDVVGVGLVVIEGYKTLATIELAYAITCHKLQGSSAVRVIIGIDYGAYMLLCCEWLYTAITRAEKRAVVVGENRAIRTAIKTRETNKKLTFLPYALKGEEI